MRNHHQPVDGATPLDSRRACRGALRHASSRKPMPRRARWVVAWVLLTFGCNSSAEVRLDMLLQTDYRAGVDFVEVRTEVLEEASASTLVDEGTSYLVATDVARFELSRATRRRVQVRLLRADGSVLNDPPRTVSFSHRRNRQQRVQVCAACEDFACPLNQTCQCGREPVCVPQGCEEEECLPTGGCTTDTDCGPSGVECVALVCREGACLRSPNDAVCGERRVCDVREGCVADPRGDAGIVEDAGIDEDDAALPDAAGTGSLERLVDLNGGTSWEGWDRVSDACDDRYWVSGSPTRTYEVYRTRFLLRPDQTVTADWLLDGAPGNGVDIVGTVGPLLEDGWEPGDRIVGVGVAYTGSTRLAGPVFFQVDYDGNTLIPASRCGAEDSVLSFDAGDTSSYFPQRRSGLVRLNYQYSVFTGFSAIGSDNLTIVHQGFGPPYGPSRSFVVIATGSTDEAVSGQFLLNLDAARRVNDGAGSGEGICSSRTRLGFNESGAGGSTQQSFPLGDCF